MYALASARVAPAPAVHLGSSKTKTRRAHAVAVIVNRDSPATAAAVPSEQNAPQSRRRLLLTAGTALLASTPLLPRAAYAKDDEQEVSYKAGPEGIQFADVVVGKGDQPFEGDLVRTNYVLTVGGKKVDYGKFFVFSVGAGEVIKGWDVILMGAGEGEQEMPPMRVGGKRVAKIPAALGYGAKGMGCRADNGECQIPPDSTLDFVIELVGIK
mmetsp:Transcript_13129/g.31623  ORF Transcript_13129/g.31623 Transcript_13129/m.31623 type:complete len:212 (+) Transcript_13129:53-688(+)